VSREHGTFINSSSDAADIPFIRDPRENPLKYPPVDDETMRAEAEHTRLAAERGMQLFREDALRDNREAAFRKAIRGLQLSPEQIADRVQQLFAPPTEPEPAEKSEEATTISALTTE
jgi:hypothetical protein